MTVDVVKGQWYRLPSKRVAEVCHSREVRLPLRDTDTLPRVATEVTLRFLDDDGAMAPGEFQLSLEFILKHCARVRVAMAADPAFF